MKHLAIFSDGIGEKILKGEKTVESRFSKRKSLPFRQISTGDLVYIKPSGKDIIGQFKVRKVIFFDGLTEEDFNQIKRDYGEALAVDESYWSTKIHSKYGTLIWIGQTQQFLTSPIRFSKKDLRGWVVLN